MAGGRNIMADGPNEILTTIVQNFWRKRPVKFDGYHQCDIPIEEDIKDLKSLCLVSPRLRSVAYRFLYDTISLPYTTSRRDRYTLMLLLRSLLENPGLRTMVRHIICAPDHYNGQNSAVHDYSWPTGFELHSNDSALDILRHAHLMTEYQQEDPPVEYVVGAILCLVTGLRILDICCYWHLGNFSGSSILFALIHGYTEMSKIITTVIEDTRIGQPRPLEELHTIHFFGKERKIMRQYPHITIAINELPDLSRSNSYLELCPVLLKAPKLTCIHGAGSLIHFMAVSEYNFPRVLPLQLKTISVSEVYITQANLDLLLSLPCLEELSLYELHGRCWENPPSDRDYLNSQLTKHAAQRLTRLALTTSCSRDRRDITGQAFFGSSSRLGCLAGFTALRELDVELSMLIGVRGNLKFTELEMGLPVSLQRLTLREQWWELMWYSDDDTIYMHDLLDTLQRFARSGKTRCPNLDSIVFRPLTETHSRMRRLRDAVEPFARMGVEFTLGEHLDS